MSNVPDFDDLPAVKDMPQGCAWGIWDTPSKKDIYGTLNHLTPTVVRAAYAELRDGISVSLNWPLNAIATAGFGRKGLEHRVIAFVDRPNAMHGYDDEISFNTQCSSQWDSLCHFHHQPSAAGYNHTRTSAAELTQAFGEEDTDGKIPTLNHWHKRGGMVARGVLIDFKRYVEETGAAFDVYDAGRITTDDIEAVAKRQGVEFRPGDVILIRSGFTEGLTGVTAEEQRAKMEPHRFGGVTGTLETARWFWNHRFAAVAGDMIAFEHVPPIVDGKEGEIKDLVLHQYFLSLFGMPIGELWDLKALSETCRKLNRYSFVLTSVPLNVPGAIGSPPNALALF